MRYAFIVLAMAFVTEATVATETADSTYSTYESSVAGRRQRALLTPGLACRILLAHAGRLLPQYRNGTIPVSFEALETRASQVLSKRAFDYVAGGAGAEKTMAANIAAFERWRIVRRVLTGNPTRSLSVEMFGTQFAAPIVLAPIGALSIVHRDADLAAARAAKKLNIPFVLSTMAEFPMELVAQETPASGRWFQLYWTGDHALNESFVRRAEASGYSAIVVTVDQFVVGWRERDLQNAYIPFLLGQSLGNFLSDPCFQTSVPRGRFRFLENIRHFMKVFPAPGLSWDDFKQLRKMTKLPLLVKGILHPDDAVRAVLEGADGIVVSNHGGRQIDGEVAALDALPRVATAVGSAVPVLFDSGIRRGSDVFKALALGAKAVLLGRPWVYGLAIAGQRGVEEVVENIAAELYTTLALAGHRDLSSLGPAAIERADTRE